MHANLFRTALDEHRQPFDHLGALQPAVERTGQRLAVALRGTGKIMACGNGGSAADSQPQEVHSFVRHGGCGLIERVLVLV